MDSNPQFREWTLKLKEFNDAFQKADFIRKSYLDYELFLQGVEEA